MRRALTRSIQDHKANECNQAIDIRADERDHENGGGASHHYELQVIDRRVPGGVTYVQLDFQHGPIKENGVNGITNEALLAILIDRMEGFQSGKYQCEENAEALGHLVAAKHALLRRTSKRLARGVESMHEL